MNKKKILSITGLLAFAAVIAINVSVILSGSTQTDISLAFIEALAQNEGGTITCNKGDCYGFLCHEYTGDSGCPCAASGDPADLCYPW